MAHVVSLGVAACSPSISPFLVSTEARRRRRHRPLLSATAALKDDGGDAPSSAPSSRAPQRSSAAFDASKKGSTTDDRLAKFKDTCYGCGVPIQTLDPSSLGYVEREAAEAKALRRGRQRGMLLCARCRALSHGQLLPGVAEPWMIPREERECPAAAAPSPSSTTEEPPSPPSSAPLRRLATPEELRAELAGIEDSASLVALVVDCLDVPGSLLSGKSLRSLVGRNPVFLIGTRADLLPGFSEGFEGSGSGRRSERGRGGVGASPDSPAPPALPPAVLRPQALSSWLADAALRRKLTVAGAAAVSSKTRAGVPFAASCLRRARAGRDVVVLGAANVGKSAFVRALVEEMRRATGPQFDAAAASVSKRLPVASAVPGTTIGRISLAAFASGGSLVDTPGLHLHHRIVHLLRPEEVGALQPRGPLRARRPPGPADPRSMYPGPDDPDEHLSAEGRRGRGGERSSDGGATPTGARAPSSLPPPPPRAATESATYLWGGLARFDLELPSTSSRRDPGGDGGDGAGVDVRFFGPAALPIAALPLVDAETSVPAEVVDASCAAPAAAVRSRGRGKQQQERQEQREQRASDGTAPSPSSSPPSRVPPAFGRESIDARGGLRVSRVVELRGTGLDVCVSGLPGWVALRPRKTSPRTRPKDSSDAAALPPSLEGKLTVWVPRGVEVFVRPPLPVEEPMSMTAMRGSGYSSGDEFALKEDAGWWSSA